MKKSVLVLALLLTPGFLVQAEILTPAERAIELNQAIDVRVAALQEADTMVDSPARQAKEQAVREEFWGKVEALYDEPAPVVTAEADPEPVVVSLPAPEAVTAPPKQTPPSSNILVRAFGAFFSLFKQ